MTQHSLAPAFVRIFYHSDFGSHVMTIPTTEWLEPSTGHDQGEFINWDATQSDADGMIRALCDALAPFFTDDNEFDSYIIYTQADADSPQRPRAQNTIAIPGTSISTQDRQAVQETWTFRTTEFGIFKLVLLDASASVEFAPIRNPTGLTAVEDLVELITDEANGWSGRDNARPANFVQIAYTLNEKLRREYGLN